jgi:hypothetical protein
LRRSFGDERVLRIQWHSNPERARLLNASVYSELGLIATVGIGAIGVGAAALYWNEATQP